MRFLFLPLLLFALNGAAQCKSYILSAKGDTLNCVDVQGRKQGPWTVRVESLRGERGYEEEGYYQNDVKVGVWRRYSLEGDILSMETYRWGFKDGKCVYFNPMGELLREESWRAIDPKNPYDTVNVYDVNDPTKVVGKQVVKREAASYRHGTWKFYDPMRGTIESTEEWVMDKKKGNDDELAPIAVSENAAEGSEEKKKPSTKPKEVLEFEKKNSGKKKIRVRDGSTGG
ncbi:MAG TPA: hypothetical protein VHK69_08940 [Chitinophagaceae bacterium]|nr:hypothetical protein [Chitinophagaceae bacterium]